MAASKPTTHVGRLDGSSDWELKEIIQERKKIIEEELERLKGNYTLDERPKITDKPLLTVRHKDEEVEKVKKALALYDHTNDFFCVASVYSTTISDIAKGYDFRNTGFEVFDRLYRVNERVVNWYGLYPIEWQRFFSFYCRMVRYHNYIFDFKESQLYDNVKNLIEVIEANGSLISDTEGMVDIALPIYGNVFPRDDYPEGPENRLPRRHDESMNTRLFQIFNRQMFHVNKIYRTDLLFLKCVREQLEMNNNEGFALNTAELYGMSFVLYILLQRLRGQLRPRLDVKPNFLPIFDFNIPMTEIMPESPGKIPTYSVRELRDEIEKPPVMGEIVEVDTVSHFTRRE